MPPLREGAAAGAADAAAASFRPFMETDAFEDGGIIPERYAGRGGNIQPGFTFSNIPAGTASFAIIFHDLDVAFNGSDDVLHWMVWNIPAEAAGLPEGRLPEGAVSGTAGIGRGNYFGPGAPAGPGTITTYSSSTLSVRCSTCPPRPHATSYSTP